MDIKNLSDVAEVIPGTSPKGEFINSKGIGYPFFQGVKEFGEIYPNPERFTDKPVRLAKEGDILFSVRAPVGRTNVSISESAIGRGVMAIRPFSSADRDYILYFLRSISQKWDSLGSTGSVFESLSVSNLREIKIPWHPRRIELAKILSSFDEKIRINQQISKTLEQIAQTIFKSWFVDFDPVHAKARGEQPVGMDENTAALFPDSFEDSELGPIPSGWEIGTLASNFNLISGGTPKTNVSDYWNGEMPWYSVVDAPRISPYFISTSKYITELGVEKSSVNVVQKDTTIISARGTVGKLALAGIETTFNQSCYGIKGIYSDYFTYFLVQNSVKRLLSMTHGGTFDTITRSTFDGIEVIGVPSGIQIAFDNFVRPLFSQMNLLQNQNATLTQIRDSLLPRLISGELEIPEDLLVS